MGRTFDLGTSRWRCPKAPRETFGAADSLGTYQNKGGDLNHGSRSVIDKTGENMLQELKGSVSEGEHQYPILQRG